ncbi:MAG: UPF0182 family protein, partial [Actinomycetota bacterium]|nr:UPF0182 family protein [Actinomycetota bacterium]
MTFDSPPPPPTAAAPPDRPPRRRRALVPTLLVLGGLLVAFALFVGFYTDWLWFRDVGYESVFTKQLWVRALLFIFFFGLTAAVVGVNGWLAYRFRPVFRSISLEQQSLDRYRIALEPFRKLALVAVSALFGFFVGTSALAEWRSFLLWQNATTVGTTDPQFNIDLSFYMFALPWWRFLVGAAMVIVVISLLVSAVVHYVYGGLRLQTEGERTTRSARAQLSVLIGVFILLKAAAYWLDRYELVLANNSLFTGAGYTDVEAVLPAKSILAVVALICGVLFLVNVFQKTWRLAVLSLGLMVLSAFIIGGIWPLIVQQFQVDPTEDVKESPYIERNIEATLDAYDLSDIQKQEYLAQLKPDVEQFEESKGTIENVRLMDPSRLSPTFDQLQQVRGYYTFQDPLDVDRYTIDGKQQDVIVAPRELDFAGVPEAQRNWINEHLTYTHGYGLVAAYGNRARPTGTPDFAEFDIPPQGLLNIEQPRVYFGERTPDYSIVGAPEGADPRELDYPDDTAENGVRSYTYTGEGGVPVGSLVNRLAYAWKFQEGNILLSDTINSESKILYIRDPRARIEQVAPWLTLDADPYATVVDGRVVWLVDGYTTSNGYPYAQRQFFGDLTTDSLTSQSGIAVQVRDQINYIRNSVKATVDAYDGTVTLYAWDESDPVLQTWRKAFPGTVVDRDQISESLLAHIRYPEDMFKVQRELYARYHVTDPQVFYTSNDAWQVPSDPTVEGVGDVAQPPYYLTLRMPGTPDPRFSLTTTYAPANRETLAAFLAVNGDATDPDYGTMRVLELPRNTTIPGPSQMQNKIESDPAVA